MIDKRFTDPTYLRTIHDGLLSGVLHKDNASALPISIVGMYEEALPPAYNIYERKKFLEFFAVWALLKKEVSSSFVLPLVDGWAEEDVLEYIRLYSKWFNSPIIGKYVLYHERLRTFILQKISTIQFMDCLEAIIKTCERAIDLKLNDEWEDYSLEWLTHYLYLDAIIRDCGGERLFRISRNEKFWNRQIEISQGFNWSKNSIQYTITYNSKYDKGACKLDYHNLLKIENKSTLLLNALINSSIVEFNDETIQQIDSILLNNEYDAQRMYIFIIIKMHGLITSNKDEDYIIKYIKKLIKILKKVKLIEFSRLGFHDVIPLKYFSIVYDYFLDNNIDTSDLIANDYELDLYNSGLYMPSKTSEHLFNKYYESSGAVYPLIPENLIPSLREIYAIIPTIDYLSILTLDDLKSILKLNGFTSDEIKSEILLLPLVFNNLIESNNNFHIIQRDWLYSVGHLFDNTSEALSLITAMLNCASSKELNSNKILEYIKQVVNGLAIEKYDRDIIVALILDYLNIEFKEDFLKHFLNDILISQFSIAVQPYIEDQKHQVLIDLHWSDPQWRNVYKDVLTPLMYSLYCEEAEGIMSKTPPYIADENEILSKSKLDVTSVDAREYLLDDFGQSYKRKYRSIESAVSVQKINWESILTFLKGIDSTTLFIIMHKIFLHDLVYKSKSQNYLPIDVMDFYHLDWINKLNKL